MHVCVDVVPQSGSAAVAVLLQAVISDVDVMWLRDPVPFFKRFPDADVLTSTDHLSSTVGAKEELERYPEAGSAFNIGKLLSCFCTAAHLALLATAAHLP
jgi:hypothetical protein